MAMAPQKQIAFDRERDDIDLEFDALSNKLENEEDVDLEEETESESMEEMELSQSLKRRRETVPTMKDSEVALDEYGNEYDEYIETFKRLHDGGS